MKARPKQVLIGLSAAALSIVLFCSAVQPTAQPEAAAPAADRALKIRIINFETCVNESKIGKQEQASFEGMKKQMESILEEKEKTLNDLATKFNDPDYLDSLSLEAETELKRKFRALNQELSQQHNQFMQTLNQAKFKVMEKVSGITTEAAKKVADKQHIDMMFYEENMPYFAPGLDISHDIIAIMDEMFDKEVQDAKNNPPAAAPVK